MMAAMEGHDAVVRALLDAGASADVKDDSGMTAAHWALSMEHEEVGMTLLEACGGYDIEDNDGITPRTILEQMRELQRLLNEEEHEPPMLASQCQVPPCKELENATVHPYAQSSSALTSSSSE